MLCICAPAIASPPPAMIAVRILGRRTIFRIIRLPSERIGTSSLSMSNAESTISRMHQMIIGNMLFLRLIMNVGLARVQESRL